MNIMNFSYKDYYKEIAPMYNLLRLDKEIEISYTLSIISRFINKNSLILDIGCGTGRYASYLKELGCNVIGVDISQELLDCVPETISTFCSSATNLPFDNNFFSCCIIILVIQLLSPTERKKAFFEAYRVLKNDGIFIIKTCSHDDLHKRPFNDLFPSALKINLQRYPDIPIIKNALEEVGFKIIEVIPTYTEQKLETSELLHSIKNKCNTTLALLPKTEFSKGCKALEKQLEKTEQIKIPHPHTIIVAKKKTTNNENDIILALRHFETKKNVMGIHGHCNLNKLTSTGKKQVKAVSSIICKNKKIRGITYFDTPQAKKSAFILSKLTQIPIEQPLSLKPYNMGIADGRTHEELKIFDPISALSLELFRNRVVDAKKIKITDSENIISLEKRILDWWENEGKERCINRIVIGSNSTLTMLSNLFDNKLPSSGKYKFFGIPTGALRSWLFKGNKWQTEPALNKSLWPEIECKKIHSKYGYIQTTLFHPGWENKVHTCIIAPGYFGNSRLGPYGLYVRLARALSFMGIECVTIDYLGSGESSLMNRTFELDVFSIDTIISKIPKQKMISVIGHSVGCSVVAEICRKYKSINGYALAPICILDELNKGFLSTHDFYILLKEGSIIRKGVYFPLEYIKSAEKSWKSNADTLKMIIIAEQDPYDINRSALNFIGKIPVSSICDADHNFSLKNSSNDLIKKIKEIIINY